MHLLVKRDALKRESSCDALTRRAQGTAETNERIEAYAREEEALEQRIAARRARLEEELGGSTRAEGLQRRRAVAEALVAARDEAEQNHWNWIGAPVVATPTKRDAVADPIIR